jgi:hypothetical protein
LLYAADAPDAATIAAAAANLAATQAIQATAAANAAADKANAAAQAANPTPPPAPANNCSSETTHKIPCLVTGGFVVPFKYELSRGHDVFGSASTNFFAGYDLGRKLNGVELTFLGFAGYSQNLSSTVNGTNAPNSTTGNTGAFSYGVGVSLPLGGTVAPVKTGEAQATSQVHIGGLIGFDHTTDSAKYLYNDRPWFSLFLGTSF